MPNPTNPFWPFDPGNFPDLTKFGGEAMRAGSALDLGAFVEAQRRNVEALAKANQLATEGLQALAHRQGEMLRQSLEQAGQVMRALMAAGSPEEKAAQQAEIARESFERAIANARELSQIATRAQTEAGDVIARRLAAGMTEIKSTIESAKKP
ncbi:MAG: phasin family protein [Rhodospirillales bacterium]|jgi:phasin family protein